MSMLNFRFRITRIFIFVIISIIECCNLHFILVCNRVEEDRSLDVFFMRNNAQTKKKRLLCRQNVHTYSSWMTRACWCHLLKRHCRRKEKVQEQCCLFNSIDKMDYKSKKKYTYIFDHVDFYKKLKWKRKKKKQKRKELIQFSFFFSGEKERMDCHSRYTTSVTDLLLTVKINTIEERKKKTLTFIGWICSVVVFNIDINDVVIENFLVWKRVLFLLYYQ